MSRPLIPTLARLRRGTANDPHATLARARRAGLLPHVRRGGKVYTTGQALLDWLTPQPAPRAGGVPHVRA
jgi:hypothetical protein